jgi:hypothetical protein
LEWMMTERYSALDTQAFLYRIGFLTTGALLLVAGYDYLQRSFALLYTTDALWTVLLGMCGFALLVIGLLPTPRYRLTSTILAGLLLVTLTRAQTAATNYSPLFTSRTDNEMIAEYSVAALRQGENPYLWNYTDMMRAFRDSGRYVTYFLDGSVQNRVTYPIFPTLMLYAFDALGLEEIRTILLLFTLVLLVLMFYGSPHTYRSIILLPLFVLHDFIDMGFRGAQDVVWSVLLVAMILTWRRPWLSALLFGIAVNYRQQPWFILPFLLIVIWNEDGTPRQRLTRMGQFVLISGVLFALFNLPFFLDNPQAWLLGALEPAYARFNWLSQGLGALTQYGVVGLPREVYSLAQFAFLAAALVVHWRHPRAVGGAFWVFPALFFWFYYRGLGNYWFYWIPVLVFGLVQNLPSRLTLPHQGGEREDSRQGGAGQARRNLTTIVLVLMIAAVPTVFTAYYVLQPPAVTLRVLAPLYLARGSITAVNQMVVQVTNFSDRMITPRFAVQFDLPTQGYVWRIIAGPHYLRPYSAANYLISADYNTGKMLLPNRNAQVVLSDAGGDYRLSAVASVMMPRDYPPAGALRNANYRYWLEGFVQPEGWIVDAPSARDLTMGMLEVGERIGLQIDGSAVAQGILSLTQTVDWLDMLSVWAYPPRSFHDRAQPYGVSIDDGTHQLRLLFGEIEARTVRSEDGLSADMLIPAREGEWSLHRLDIRTVYTQLGWHLPAYSINEEGERPQRSITIRVLVPLRDAAVVAPEIVVMEGDGSDLDAMIDALVASH